MGRIRPASNVALLVRLGDEAGPYAIYKPVAGERELWDFPDGTLAAREYAAYRIASAGGFGLVPPTVLRAGPYGAGSVQQWIGDPEEGLTPVVDVVPHGEVPEGWTVGFEGEDQRGAALSVVVPDLPGLRSMAVLDVVLNNSDRKGAHLGLDASGVLWGFDHGLTCHAEPKLRTILWSWVGQPLDQADLVRLRELGAALTGRLGEELREVLTVAEVSALSSRVAGLLASGVFPAPAPGWPSVPWPPL